METFHLLHLASVWKPQRDSRPSEAPSTPIPPTTSPVKPAVTIAPSIASTATDATDQNERKQGSQVASSSRIRAAAVQMIFANRVNQDFIDPQRVEELEAWAGKAVLDALIQMNIPEEVHAVFLMTLF